MNKQELIRKANDQLIGQGDMQAIEQFFTAAYLAHAEEKEYQGHAFIKRFIRQVRSAIPDVSVRKVSFFVEAGDTIAWKRTLQGTHKADMMGIPASNKKVKWEEMLVSRFEGDKIAEEWLVSDLAGQLLLKQPKAK